MFEVIIEKICYIRDIPLELTEEALSSGLLCKGAVLGLYVHTPDAPEKKIQLDLKLTEPGQEKLLKSGIQIPLESQGSHYRFSHGWREYLEKKYDQKKPQTDKSSDSKRLRPNPGHF